jgi:hypothetical protein
MRRVAAFSTASLVVIASSACTPASACPRTVDEARQVTWDEEIVGGGHVIRFVPSPLGSSRGYDVNLTRPVSGSAQMDTYFLRTPVELDGIEAGMPVLLIGARTDRRPVVVAGACPALTPTTEEDVTWRLDDADDR